VAEWLLELEGQLKNSLEGVSPLTLHALIMQFFIMYEFSEQNVTLEHYFSVIYYKKIILFLPGIKICPET
jgi:hypothetical protein